MDHTQTQLRRVVQYVLQVTSAQQQQQLQLHVLLVSTQQEDRLRVLIALEVCSVLVGKLFQDAQFIISQTQEAENAAYVQKEKLVRIQIKIQLTVQLERMLTLLTPLVNLVLLE